MSINDAKNDGRNLDDPFDSKNTKLYNEYMNIRGVLDKTNVENGIDMTSADLGRTSLAAMRYMKNQELSRANRLDPDSPIDGAVLSKANPSTGVAAGQYLALYQGQEYERMRVQGIPTSELGRPADLSVHEIRTFEAELQQQRQQRLQHSQEQQRNRDEPQQNGPSTGARSLFG